MDRLKKFGHNMPGRFIGVDFNFYEIHHSDPNMYDQLEDINGAVVRSIAKREAFELVDWPRGMRFRILTKEGGDINRKELITDTNLNILQNGEGNMKDMVKVLYAKHGRDNVRVKQLEEIIIYAT